MSGFRSYADETTFEWEGRSLVGIVGPIGSGKSSILDGISFALYGKTPRIGQETKSLINQRRDSMQISLTFDVDGETWKAVRALRRSGSAAHALYRVEDGADVEVTDRAREMAEKVEALLGLDFDAFRRSVLLAQNQFAEFLEAGKTERDKVLQGVFGFERLDAMRAAAKERLDVVEKGLATLKGRRAAAAADAEELAQKRKALEAADERVEALEQLRPQFKKFGDLIEDARQKVVDAQRRIDRLDELSDRIPDRDRTESILGAAGDAAGLVEAARESVAAAARVRSEAAAGLKTSLAAVGGREGLDGAAELVHAWRAAGRDADQAAQLVRDLMAEKSATEAGLAAAAEAVGVAIEASSTTAASEREATATVEAARTAYAQLQDAHRAHSLREGLTLGEPCPVCTRPVTVIPTSETPLSLDEARTAVEEAEPRADSAAAAARDAAATLAASRAEEAAAREAVAAVTGRIETAEAASVRAQEAVAVAKAAVEARLGAGDPEQRLDETRAMVGAAEATLAAAGAEEEAARTALAEAERAAGAVDSDMVTLRSEVAAARGALDLRVDIGEDADALRSALLGLREEWVARRQAAEGDRVKAEEEAAAAAAGRGDLLEAAGLGASDDLAEVTGKAVNERSAIEAEVQLLERRLSELEQLGDEEAGLVAQSELLGRLHDDLAPSRFLKFVLDERRRALGDLASVHLEMLTAGRYRFDDTGDFLLVDLTAADSVRAPASLSGGESFLASLALALALAEVVAREGGRLDSFFLDEGFGSLDPEHLDLAMSGIERLVSAGPERLVVVVSHVPALSDRIEDLVVLDRDPITGNTRVVSGRSAT